MEGVTSAKVGRRLSVHTFRPEVALFPHKTQALKAPLVAPDDAHQWAGVRSWESMKERIRSKEAIPQEQP